MFKDRTEVGKMLGDRIRGLGLRKPIVLAIPRGGVPVAKEIALSISAPLDLVITRKIGHPEEPEFAVGAVTQDGEVIFDKQVVETWQVPKAYLREEARRQVSEIKRRMDRFRGKRSYPSLSGRDVVIVDDGIATGNTILAAIESVKRKKPASITLAVGVAPRNAVNRLSSEVDSVVCLATPVSFSAIGEFYMSFEQVQDEEVIAILSEVNLWSQTNSHSAKALPRMS